MKKRKEFSKRPPDGIFGPNATWIHGGSGTPDYIAYQAAKTICTNVNHPSWPRYGGRGIEFRFASFSPFSEHLGRRPAGTVLDRRNREGHFEIGNVYWRRRRRKQRRPLPVNTLAGTPTIKKVVLWLTVRHPEGGVVSYPMFRADEGLAWLEMREALRPEDAVIAVTPCTEQSLVIETNGQLDMGTTVEEVRSWAEEAKARPQTPLSWNECKSAQLLQ
jgi:hypothetical protein